jgi:cytochrome c oxidase accessory protein FixG
MQNQIPVRFIDDSHKTCGTKVTVQKAQDKIYVRAVRGIFDTFRKVFGGLFIAIFILIPWLTYNGKQAILLDFSAQRFHLFNVTLWPQDLTVLAWLLMIAAFALFFITAIWGRVWCGFMCPQTVFTFLFVWSEEQIEGSRNKRIHLDQQSINLNKVLRKLSKHSVWLLISIVSGLSFVAYFMPAKALFSQFFLFELNFWPLFYVLLFSLCTYLNAGWMREIMCTHMCPYSRFQSAMFDQDTLTVTYDRARGEGRGPRSKKLSKLELETKGLGDCIDCNLCVQVCPTGIDIRNGLQYECINCGACVDACNGVMDKMHYKKGLIAYASESILNGNKVNLTRPKVIGYLSVLLLMSGLLVWELYTRPMLDLDVVRDRTTLFRDGNQGKIENIYTLVLMNKSQQPQTYDITIMGLSGADIIGKKRVLVKPSELVRHPVYVERHVKHIEKSITDFSFVITDTNSNLMEQKTTFIYK